MSFTEKKIEVQFTYGTGPKGDGPPTGVTTATITGCRVSMQTNIIGGEGMAQCNGRIYGMGLSLMNQLSRVGKMPAVWRDNVMTLKAGDDVVGMSQIFQGTVIMAFPDMQSAPEVSFMVGAISGGLEQLKPIPSSSYNSNSVDVAVILGNLAQQMKVKFENNGVSKILSYPHFKGSARNQALDAVKQADIEWNGIENGILAIWPKGGTRGGEIPLINPGSGMIGYPTYTENGIFVKCLFNPSIRFGQIVQVESDIKPANGQWKVINLIHNTESKIPGGHWNTEMQLVLPEAFGVSH